MRCIVISLALLLSALTVAHARPSIICGGLTQPTPSCPCVGSDRQIVAVPNKLQTITTDSLTSVPRLPGEKGPSQFQYWTTARTLSFAKV
jgi:hypothetical protein